MTATDSTEYWAALDAALGSVPRDAHEAETLVDRAVAPLGITLARRDDLVWSTIGATPQEELDQAELDQEELDQAEFTSLECGSGRLITSGAAAGDYALVAPSDIADERIAALLRACVWLSLIRARGALESEVRDFRDESTVVGELAKQVLSVSDLDQVLLTIATETLRMSESDICGVFLREGDEVRMRSCVGHRLVETSRLRMSPGQGVAGMVLATRAAAKVDSYLQDMRISKDFMALAEQEETRSALAVPLLLGDDLVGVLEVWRRRYSNFTERDVRRLESLADLVTIAIDNARLYGAQRAAVTELQAAQSRLEAQVTLLDETAQLQKSLIDIVLENGPVLVRVTRTLAEHLDATVAVVSADGAVEALYPRDTATADLESAFAARRGALHRTAATTPTDGGPVLVHPIELGSDGFGAVCVQGDRLDEDRTRVGTAQAALACALFHLQQRSASLARSEALDQVLWDLMDGSSEHRSAARGRAQQMGVWLRGWHRVLYGSIQNFDAIARQEDWGMSAADRTRRTVLETVRAIDSPVQPTLAGVRGNWFVALVPIKDRDRAREFLRSLTSALAAAHPDVTMAWGLSTAREHPGQFPEAFAEARTALAAARRLGAVSLYDDLGIVRLLLGHEDADFTSFVTEITGPLQEYDASHDGALMQTLRAYFDSNCSHKDAAELLFVHHKTLAYRLERIRKLTGLDLSQHSDRMRADLALRLLEVSEQADSTRFE